MKHLMLAVLLTLGMASTASAMNCPQLVDTTTEYACTEVVYNDGTALASGVLVIYDNDDTELDRTGYPYVTTTTSADSDWVAGVTTFSGCPANSLCSIVVRGFAWTQVADATDAVAEDTLVSSSTVAGMAGDYAPAANTCAIGTVLESIAFPAANGGDSNADGQLFPVWVERFCQ